MWKMIAVRSLPGISIKPDVSAETVNCSNSPDLSELLQAVMENTAENQKKLDCEPDLHLIL